VASGIPAFVPERRRHPDYHGKPYVDLGAAFVATGCLNPRIVADAASSGHDDNQDLKCVWHCLARFGVSA